MIFGGVLFKCAVYINGYDNRIVFEDGVILTGCRITISGNQNSIRFASNVNGKNVSIVMEDNNNTIEIGENTVIRGETMLAVMESTRISIGEDCLFSSEIHFRTGDSHSLLDISGKRMNVSKDICISNHVWIGAKAVVLKGAKICENSIVAIGSIVTKAFNEPNVVIAGNPARIVKQNINWCKERI